MKYFGFVLKEESEKTSIVSHSIMISDDYIIAQFDIFNKYDKLIASNVIDALRQKKDEDGQNFFGIIWNAIFKYSGHFIFNKDPIDYYAKKDEYEFQTSKWFYRQIMNMNRDITIDLFQKVILGIINQYEGRPIGPGKVVYYNPDPQLFKPSITCLEEDNNTLYVYLRGSYEPQDWISDFYCNEVGEVIQDVSIIFHYGFLTAANNIIKLIGSILKKYNTIYLIGHSYGGAIACVLNLLCKSSPDLCDKNFYTFGFGCPPAMSFCPTNVKKSTFIVINKNDIVPSCCMANFINTAKSCGVNPKDLIGKLNFLAHIIHNKAIMKIFKEIQENPPDHVNCSDVMNVRHHKGILFRIGTVDTKKLNDCIITDCYYATELVIAKSSFNDHDPNDYRKEIDKFESID